MVPPRQERTNNQRKNDGKPGYTMAEKIKEKKAFRSAEPCSDVQYNEDTGFKVAHWRSWQELFQ